MFTPLHCKLVLPDSALAPRPQPLSAAEPCCPPRPALAPAVFNGKQLYDVMVERCGPSVNSGPKK